MGGELGSSVSLSPDRLCGLEKINVLRETVRLCMLLILVTGTQHMFNEIIAGF